LLQKERQTPEQGGLEGISTKDKVKVKEEEVKVKDKEAEAKDKEEELALMVDQEGAHQYHLDLEEALMELVDIKDHQVPEALHLEVLGVLPEVLPHLLQIEVQEAPEDHPEEVLQEEALEDLRLDFLEEAQQVAQGEAQLVAPEAAPLVEIEDHQAQEVEEVVLSLDILHQLDLILVDLLEEALKETMMTDQSVVLTVLVIMMVVLLLLILDTVLLVAVEKGSLELEVSHFLDSIQEMPVNWILRE